MGHSKWVGACALAAACYLGGQIIAQEPAADDPFGGVAPGAPPAVSDAADPFATERSAQTLVDAYGNPIELGRGAAETSDRAAYQSAQRRIESTLGQRLKSPLDFPETPLSSIMQLVSDEYDIPIVFDTMALEAVAQSPDTEITANYNAISLRSALELMFGQVEDLTYIIDNEVLLITTEDVAESRLLTIVYQVDDLVPRQGGGGYGGGDATHEAAIVDVITRCVVRDSWARNKTGEGEICVLDPGVMVVSQTQRVHDEVARLLAEIRRVKAAIKESPRAGGF
jgi:hypothetical protein